MRGLFLPVIGAIALVAAAILIATQVSPWPRVLVLRHVFDREAGRAMAALEPRLPAGLTEHPDLPYGPAPRERLDLVLPPGPAPPGGWPVLLWVHGGAFLAGQKEDVGNHLRLIAAQGYATIAPDYARAPARRHPAPAEDMLKVLIWIEGAAGSYPLDPARLVLAGDSAGSHIALQTAIALADPAYARALRLRPSDRITGPRGLVLFCGIFDLAGLETGSPWMQTAAWAYLGHRDPAEAPDAPLFSLLAHLPETLPPLFVSAGNADPLLPQSRALVDQARARGLRVEALFFPPDQTPLLGHEYQFGTDAAADLARDRLLAFLKAVTAPAP